ncbi:uncharacterized protein LOC131237684 isoform X2 [Magnolia sinica]|uniref:uncharacterized protein LOC131237684 isoform X2 n=1 Tax=Magnolia sinica TaxID=86752 RepID=UPI002658DDE1|nr:uncharacterized protein LOC131237684 isoform X2 [Magnolia sinica]
MAPSSSRSDSIEDDNDDAFDGDTGFDDDFDEDMEALRRACILTGTNPDTIQPPAPASTAAAGPDPDSGSDMDDLELVRSIQQRFYLPSLAINSLKPRGVRTPSDSDDEEDFETLRAIQRRFMQYDADALKKNSEKHLQIDELVCTTSIAPEENTSNIVFGNRNNGEALGEDFPDSDDAHANSQPLQYFCDRSPGSQPSGVTERHQPEDGTSNLSVMPFQHSSFPKSAQMFIAALKKNRSCQKFIRSRLIQIEARIEENKELRRRFKYLMDFQVACKRRVGKFLSQPKDPRIELISLPKLRVSNRIPKANDKVSPMCLGPDENSHVPNYKMVLENCPISLRRQLWSKVEKENLVKGIKQQFQEMLLRKSIENYCGEGSSGDSNVDSIIASINDLEITPENIRSFLPHVDWERLASMYVTGRSGAECEARWLNSEDPIINHNPWTNLEDKNLLFIAQQRGIYNWIEIAASLGTNRTPFQCLARYQRSLNAYILRRDWTEEEDAQLRAVVKVVGENDWQRVASILGSRTGPQCSNRWRKTLHPSRKRVGRWTVDEDKHLKIAVMLFGQKTWMKIAQFVPGRTQVQCRERWVNTLDPSLNLEPWTEEEDSKLKAAIAEHGHCWSKIAAMVPPRTDSQCRRRWKVLFPHEVPLLQAARKIQKVALISNFVDREEQRPALGPSDFISTSAPEMKPLSESGNEDNDGKRKRKSRVRWKSEKHMDSHDDPQPSSIRRSKTRAKSPCKGTSRKRSGDDAETPLGDAAIPSKRQKRRPPATKAKTLPNKLLGITDGDDAIPKKREKKRPPKIRAEAHSNESLRTSDDVAKTSLGDNTIPKRRKQNPPKALDVAKTSHGDSSIPKKRKKQDPPKVLSDSDKCSQPAGGHGDQLGPEHPVLEVTDTIDALLDGNPKVTDDMALEARSRKPRAKRKAHPKEVLDASDSDDVTIASVLRNLVKRRRELADNDIVRDPAVKALPRKRGKKKVPKLLFDRDSCSQLAGDEENIQCLGHSILDVTDTTGAVLCGTRTEDGIEQSMRTSYNGIADDALLGSGETVADQAIGTNAKNDSTSLKKQEKNAHKLVQGDEHIHPVEDHEALSHLDQSILQSLNMDNLFLNQLEASGCSLSGKSVSGEPPSCRKQKQELTRSVNGTATTPLQIQESQLNSLEQTVPTVDCVQQWAGEGSAEDRLMTALCSSLEGWDIIEQVNGRDENHDSPSRSDDQNGRPCNSFHVNGVDGSSSDHFSCGTGEPLALSSSELIGSHPPDGSIPCEMTWFYRSMLPAEAEQPNTSLPVSGNASTEETKLPMIVESCDGR